MKVYADDTITPTAPTDRATHVAKARTTAGVDWDAAFSGTWNTSPSIVSVIQELVDSYDYSGGEPLQILLDDDGSDYIHYNNPLSYDYDDNSYGPKLNITYSEVAAFTPKVIFIM